MRKRNINHKPKHTENKKGKAYRKKKCLTKSKRTKKPAKNTGINELIMFCWQCLIQTLLKEALSKIFELFN
jgi:hypothetical protein